jgi:hypothetical protein
LSSFGIAIIEKLIVLTMKRSALSPARLKVLTRSGRLDLSGEMLDDLSFIGSRAALKHLDLSLTSLQTLTGLTFQPHIESINLDSSDLQNFKNFSAIQKVTSVSIKSTPVSQLPHFKLSLVLVLGPSLRVINGVQVTEKLKSRAREFPAIAAALVNCGWIVEYPCPEGPQLDEIKEVFGFSESGPPPAPVKATPKQSPKRLSISPKTSPTASQSSFIDQIQGVLERYGYAVDGERKGASILRILSSLFKVSQDEDPVEKPDGWEKFVSEIVTEEEDV